MNNLDIRYNNVLPNNLSKLCLYYYRLFFQTRCICTPILTFDWRPPQQNLHLMHCITTVCTKYQLS